MSDQFATAVPLHYLLICTVLGWFATLTGVALGGFLVYRTKRDGETLFSGTKKEKGEAFNLQDDFMVHDDEKKHEPVEIPDVIQKNSNRFIDQMFDRIAGGSSSDAEK